MNQVRPIIDSTWRIFIPTNFIVQIRTECPWGGDVTLNSHVIENEQVQAQVTVNLGRGGC